MPYVTCKKCGKEFEVPRSRLQTAKFCSTECKYQSMHHDGRIDAVCETCGKDFRIYPSRLKLAGGRFCSVACVRSTPNPNGSKWWIGNNRMDVDVDEMVRMYSDGHGSNEIADHFGMKGSTVRLYLTRSGTAMRTNQEAQQLRSALGKSTRERAANWKGGIKRSHGYVYVYMPEHKRASKNYAKRSHVVWEKHHGKEIPEGMEIHHLNGIKDDDRPENLVVLSKSDHSKISTEETLQYRIRELEQEIARLNESLNKQEF